MLNKEGAKQNLLKLIDVCIKTGGIFENAETVAAMVNSVHILDAQQGFSEQPAMVSLRGTASQQLQERINNLENSTNGEGN